MKIYRSFVILIAVVLVITLAACVRPIPGSENPEPTVEGGAEASPGATSDVMGQIYLFATQTAMATQGLITPAGQVTPQAPPSGPTPTAMTVVTQPPPEIPAPTKAAIVAPTATPGLPTSYALKKGEFPYCIARRFNVNPGELLRINNLTSTSVYSTGMVLRIPQTGNPFPGNRSLRSHPTTYIVNSGDTIYSIACLYGDVDPEAIAYVNGITSPNKQLSPGTTIDIP